MDITNRGEKETVLTRTINELKRHLGVLDQKKSEVQLKLDDIKSRLEVTREEEQKTEKRMQDILKVEAKLEELMNEERRLLLEKSAAESELVDIQGKLKKIDNINK